MFLKPISIFLSIIFSFPLFIALDVNGAPTDTFNVTNPEESSSSFLIPPSFEELGFILQDDIWVPSGEGSPFSVGQAADPVTKWEGGKIPYYFDRQYPADARKQVEQGISQWNQRMGECLKLTPGQSSDRSFVIIGNGDGCYSYVGRRPQGQWLSLNARGCTRPETVIHEFMHAAGFYHEHQRTDRDDYITVHFENIREEWRQSWERLRSMKKLVEFNCQSIMHYSAVHEAYSINGKPAFSGKPGVDCEGAGHRKDFADSDITAIKKFYGCEL